MNIFLKFVLALAFVDINYGSKNLRRKEEKATFSKSLTINYPLHFFNTETERYEWRTKAKYDQNFVNTHETSRSWMKYLKAQDGEESWLYENWFYGMTNGVIMESGALDGMHFSTSYLFENFANWSSIHVEADPENYSILKRERTNSININCALCSEPKLLHFSNQGGRAAPVRGFIELMSPGFIKRFHSNILRNETKIEDLPTVQCVKVKTLLQELRVKHVDIWVLDVEGAEESVLKGTDFNEVHFNAICMECDEHNIEGNQRKVSILEQNGFQCYLIERNCMCKHNDFVPSEVKTKSLYRSIFGNRPPYKGEVIYKNATSSKGKGKRRGRKKEKVQQFGV